jgi:hypothetical protein
LLRRIARGGIGGKRTPLGVWALPLRGGVGVAQGCGELF